MKRIIFIILVTLVGSLAAFVDAFWGLLLYTWYAFASPLELTYGSLEGTRLSFVVGAVLVLTTFNQRKTLFTSHPLTFFCYLFIAICFSSLAYTGQFSLSYILVAIELVMKMIFIAMLVPVLLDSLPRFRTYIQTIAVSAGFVGAYFGIFGLMAGSTNIYGPGRLGDNNAYAASLVPILPLIFFGGRYLPAKIPKFIGMCATFSVFTGTAIAVILTFSRGGFLSLVTAVACLMLKLRGFLPRMLGWGVVLPILVLATMRFYALDPALSVLPTGSSSTGVQGTFDDYVKRILSLRADVRSEESASGRLHFWEVAMEMARQNPLFGVGLERYTQEYDNYDYSQGRYGQYRAVHNLFFSVLAETGWIGSGVFLTILLLCFLAQFRAYRYARQLTNREAQGELMDYANMAAIALISFLVASCFLTTLFQEILWGLVSISIGLELLAKRMV